MKKTVESLIAELRALRMPEATSLAKGFAKAEEIRLTPLRITAEDKHIINENGYSRAQSLNGGRSSAIESNQRGLARRYWQFKFACENQWKYQKILGESRKKLKHFNVTSGMLAMAKQELDRQEEERLFELRGHSRAAFEAQTTLIA